MAAEGIVEVADEVVPIIPRHGHECAAHQYELHLRSRFAFLASSHPNYCRASVPTEGKTHFKAGKRLRGALTVIEAMHSLPADFSCSKLTLT